MKKLEEFVIEKLKVTKGSGVPNLLSLLECTNIEEFNLQLRNLLEYLKDDSDLPIADLEKIENDLKKLDEKYIQNRKDNPLRDEVFPYTVPEGQIFVLGDNRHRAIDSRMRDLGCIDNDKIIGQVVMKIYPITHFSVY